MIRHAKDFGAVTFCDVRLGTEENVNKLSGWLRTAKKGKERNYEESLKSFFEGHLNPTVRNIEM